MKKKRTRCRSRKGQKARRTCRFGLRVLSLFILIVCSAATAQTQELPKLLPRKPHQALESMETRPGFHMELVACEPHIRDPIAIAFDENGRMFVLEFPEYNHQHAGWTLEETGKIRVLDDTNGDGAYDRSRVYVDGIAAPTGLICWDGGIFVAAAPDILFFRDTTGDSRADLRKTVFTGFNISENRGGGARLNSLRWGLDNRIHLSTSFSGGMVHRASDNRSSAIDVRNRGFAFDPRTLEMEATSGAGQHGLAIDDWARRFLCNNSDPFRLLMYESRYAVRNPHTVAPQPYVSIAEHGKFTKLFRTSQVEPWRLERTRRRVAGLYRGSAEGGTPSGFFTSATGIAVYRGDAWPEKYRGDIFICQPSGNLIHRATLAPNGLELTARRADIDAEFATSRDNWFRPVELVNSPDGTLFVVDMYRELIETALALPPDVLAQLQPGGGTRRGRIFRIAPNGVRLRRQVQFKEESTDDLVRLLEHRNVWHRDTAARLLLQRQDQAAVAPLQRLIARSGLDVARATALYALDGLDALNAETLLSALNDPSDNVRVHAMRLAEQVSDAPTIRKKLLSMTDDPSLHVRYQLAFSLGEFDGSAPLSALTALLLSDGTDHWVRFAVLSSLRDRAGVVFETLVTDPAVDEQVHRQKTLVALARQIGAAAQEHEIAAFARSLNCLSADDGVLKDTLVKALVDRQSSTMRSQILMAGGSVLQRHFANLLAAAKQRAVDEMVSTDERSTATRTLGLGTLGDNQQLFAKLLGIQQPPSIQMAAMEALAGFGDPKVADLILTAWPRISPQLRAQGTETLLSRNSWLTTFFAAVENGQIARSDVDPARISLLRKHPDQHIRQQVERIFHNIPSRRADIISDYQQALLLDGDSIRGKQVFKKVCSACHKLDGVGTATGAELAAIRNRAPSEVLLNILDPNREVKPKFVSYVIQTSDGRVVTGMIASESATGLVLHRPDGTEAAIQRTEIEALSSTGLSFMPEGLEKNLDLQAMADLLKYLTSAN